MFSMSPKEISSPLCKIKNGIDRLWEGRWKGKKSLEEYSILIIDEACRPRHKTAIHFENNYTKDARTVDFLYSLFIFFGDF